MADEDDGVVRFISCKLFHLAKACFDLLSQEPFRIAKRASSKLFHISKDCVDLLLQQLFRMSKHASSELFHSAKGYASLLSHQLLDMANYIQRELLHMSHCSVSLISSSLSQMASYILSLLLNTALYIPRKLFDTARGSVSLISQGLWHFSGTNTGKASALILALILLREIYRTRKGKAIAEFLVLLFDRLFDSGKRPKGIKPPPSCPAAFIPRTEIHVVGRTNEPKTDPKPLLPPCSSLTIDHKNPRKVYTVPDDLKGLKGKVPQVPTKSRTAATYSDYVYEVLHAEDYHIEETDHEPSFSFSGSSTMDHKNLNPIYSIPDDLKDLIKMGKIPPVLTKPITASTYSGYFAALLHEEDYYIEKWNGFLMSEVTLQLHEELSRDRITKKRYVKFEIDSIPEKRPFLLSRDFVFIKHSGKRVQPFQGSLSRVMKNIWVLAEFKDDFYSQFSSQSKYDISFSFNRVPLKRTHEAIAAASDPSFHTFLFPDPTSQISFSIPTADRFLGQDQTSTIISRIFSLKSSPPYLVEGPRSGTDNNKISRTGVVLVEAILQLYRASPHHRILVVAPRNNTCDMLMGRLQLEIPGSETFRANAAFRDPAEVPEDIFSSCLYEGECFKCPPLAELQKYRVITSTYISSFRIRTAGIKAGHFSHIFLVDASSATEPELMVALTNLANEKTAVVVTGSLKDSPAWVRSDIARKMGLRVSYFERLMKSQPYSDQNPRFVGHLEDKKLESY